MRIKVHCQNRIGILRDILNLLVEYGINVARGEVGGEQGNAIYLHCPNLINLQFQSLRPKFEAISGVFGVKRVGLMPSERRHLELNALLGALDFPVLSIDMGGSIVAANRSAAQLLGVRVDEVPGMALSRYAEDFDLPELVRANKSRINGLRVKVKGDVFLADIAPLQSEHDDSEAMAGAVLTLHRADRVGEREVVSEQVVFDHGDLAVAMRASMAVPGAFAPVTIEPSSASVMPVTLNRLLAFSDSSTFCAGRKFTKALTDLPSSSTAPPLRVVTLTLGSVVSPA